MSSRVRHLGLVWGIILIFWGNGLDHLDTWPLVHEDEPWIMSPGYTFWGEGRFASDLFSGFYNMEDHYFALVPVFSLFNGGLARLIGLGLFQTRLGALTLMLLALAATYSLGRRLFSPQVGLIAIIFLTFFRIAAPFFHLKIGIPFVDAARIARYDMAVPIFGLLALLSVSQGLLEPKTKRVKPSLSLPLFFMAGLWVGLASLSHVYGIFWLPALAVGVIWVEGRISLKPLVLMGCGFALPWLPYLFFVASGWPDFLGQHLVNRSRAALTDPLFYLNNLLHEVNRYQAIYQALKLHLAAWLFCLGFPLSLLLLFYRAAWLKEASARLLLVALTGLLAGFALLVSTKTYTYLATVWPLVALTLALGAVYLWRLPVASSRWRPLLMAILLAVVMEGGWGMVQFQQAALKVTPYTRFTAELSQFIPPGSRILAFQHYWLGLSHFNYRSMLAPIFMASSQHAQTPITFYQALTQSGANVIIVDEVMYRYLEVTSAEDDFYHQNWVDFNQYLVDHQARVLAQFRDPSYGRVTIYLISAGRP